MRLTITAFVLLLAITLFSYSLHAQTAPSIEWQHCYGGSTADDGTGDQDLNPPKDHTLIRTSDGGYAFLGETDSDDGDVSGNHVWGISATEDFWLVKTDASGNIQWQKCFGGTSVESPKCLIQTSDGGYAMCGWTRSHDGDVTDPYPDSVLVNLIKGYRWTATEGWIVKTDSIGRKEWARNIGPVTGYYEDYNSLIEVPDGFIITGSSDGSDEDWHAHSQLVDSTNLKRPTDALILKLNSSGQHVWHRLLGGNGYDEAMCVLPCPGGYIFAGTAWSTDTDSRTGLPGDVKGVHVPDAYHVHPDAWAVRLDNIGRILWQKCYGGTAIESTKCIIKIPEGYMIAASATSNDGDVTGNHGGQDAWVFTIDTNGTLLNQRCFGGDSTDVINSIVRLSDGNYAFAGQTISTDGDVSGLHHGEQDSTDAWAGEFSPDLKLLWQSCLGGTKRDVFGTVIETSDGGLLLNGATISNNGDVNGLHPGKNANALATDIWNVKLRNPNANVEQGNAPDVINLYPNPATQALHFNTQSQHISLSDALGRACVIPNQDGTLDVSTLPPGVYYVNTERAEGGTLHAKFVKE